MATRVYCDHCGNTISGKSPNKFTFGPLHYANYLPTQNIQWPTGGLMSGGLSGIAQSTMTMVSSVPSIQTETIDLCDICMPIWMNRVRDLCRRSDPEKE